MGPGGGLIRLFAGVEVPPAVGSAIDAWMTAWRGWLPDLRFTPPGDRHVTLAFLGEVERSAVPEIAERLRGAAASIPGFETALGGIGGFPSATRATVVWAGLDDPSDDWSRLATAVRAGLSDVFALGTSDFVSHITLGRSPRPVAIPSRVRAAVAPRVGFPVKAVALFRSQAQGLSGRYEVLDRFGLRPEA